MDRYLVLYIDIIFLQNLVVNYIILLVTARFSKCKTSNLRLFLGALIGASYVMILILLPGIKAYYTTGAKIALSLLMVAVAFSPEKFLTFFKTLALFYFSTFLFGGAAFACEIGPRPIDLHIKALRAMGAKIHDAQHGYIYCEADRLKGCELQLDYPSVGATENAMLAAVFADGDTYIRNAAKEPEIIDLQNFLNAAGVSVTGAGTSVIRVIGKSRTLKHVEHTVIPDRIVAGTYMVASAITGGDVLLRNIVPEHLSSIIYNLRESGSRINVKRNALHISGPARPRAIDLIRTLPYPGFPTDMQAQMVVLLSIARGTSIVVETIFENRYKHVEELLRMGANIKLEGRLAVIKGVKRLTGASVVARDLRGGAALVLAGMIAEGETIVNDVKYIDRGYECIEKKLSQIGAIIRREQ